MGKNIKSYATIHSPGKGRGALRQKVFNLSFKIWYGLTVHIIRFYRQNFQFFKNCPIKSGSSELRKFRAVRPHSPRITQNLHILLTLPIMFQVPAPAENPGKFQRIMQIPHDSPTQPANHANSAHFAL